MRVPLEALPPGTGESVPGHSKERVPFQAEPSSREDQLLQLALAPSGSECLHG